MEEEGETTMVLGDGWLVRFLNMLRIESALDTFGRPDDPKRFVWAHRVGSIASELDIDSLLWVEDRLCGERSSMSHGEGGIELARRWAGPSGRSRALFVV